MKRFIRVLAVLLCIGLLAMACGKQADKPQAQAEKPKPAEAPKPEEKENKGEAVAKEIIDTFDQAVTEAADLVKDKPPVEEVKPKLEAMIVKYKEQMTELNGKYLALKDEDIALFGDACSYIDNHRPKRVFESDKILGPVRTHYGIDSEVGKLLYDELINLLEIGTAH